MASALIVGFVSQKGGVGKSTLARALGAVVASGGFNVRIADIDPYQQTVVEWERVRGRSGERTAISVEAFETAGDALASAQADELLIIDAPAHANRATLEIAKEAALIVQPTGASLDDLRPAVLLFHELVQAGIPKERLVIALCRTLSQSEEDAARAYIERAGYAVLSGCVPERGAYRQAHNRGQAITEAGTNARVDELMKEMCRLVAAQLKQRVSKRERRSRKEAS